MQHEPRLSHVDCPGAHRMAYWEWGDAVNPNLLVCVHGLSRQGRDFDVLAQAMADEYRVVCPDVVGRGQSDRLTDPAGYALPTYVVDMLALLAQLQPASVRWVGTSMGGLIGIALASLPQSPLQRLVLNDVGPVIQAASIARIGSYLGLPLRWATLDEAADYLWTISQGFGAHSREQWMALTAPMLVADRVGDVDGFRLHYDPAIALAIRGLTPEAITAGEAALWAAYDAVRCPTLLLRGADSDLLLRETAQAMTQRGPRATLHEFAAVGHAPTLVTPQQVQVVREFLISP